MWAIWFWLKEANKGLFRNFIMNSFALLLSIVCFAILAISTTIGINAKYISANQEEKIQVILHLKDDVKNYQQIEDRIRQLQEVKSFVFVSKDEAYEQMKQSLGKKQDMLTDLNFNPLPASFEINLKNPRDVKRVVKIIESWGVDENVKYGAEFLDNYFKVTDRINKIAFWVIIVMAFATASVIYSSIRMNILNRNKEIEIKDLVGAGMLNVRIPFVFEAVILTIISASIVLAGIYFYYEDMIKILLSDLPIVMFMSVDQVMRSLIPPMYLVAIVIGIVSSVLSTQRYLKRH
ncbi:cell division protein FtsX [Priestia megaterium]|uniref:Cell division protein FtsX n=1 Tax=Priestia megaterium TaxID=1404 RepID=A0A6M6E7W0_PRIMG|nr:permease-like cell division protein FtsX [Priestia megaterium]QJX80558.1 FtsX-like permease family protein [Priestia megaterium]